jgi:hypothetical protein
MANELTKLCNSAEQLLLAELAVFLHNIGKCGEDFIYEWSRENRAVYPKDRFNPDRYYEQYTVGVHRKVKEILGYAPAGWEDRINQAETKKTQDAVLRYLGTGRNPFWDLTIKLPKPLDDRDVAAVSNEEFRDYRLGYFVEFHKGVKIANDPFKKVFGDTMNAIAVCQRSHHLASVEEKEEDLFPLGFGLILQPQNRTSLISPFGYRMETYSSSATRLIYARRDLIKMLLDLEPGKGATETFREEFLEKCKTPFQIAPGDTRFPINDVRLWDLSHSTASFFKSAIAGKMNESGFEKSLQWQYLTLTLDFLQFAASAQKIIDVVARRDKFEECYAALKKLLETEYPLANEIYRDEYGPVYLIPASNVLEWDDGRETLRDKILHCFRAPAHPKQGKEGISEKIIEALPLFQIEAFIEKTPTLQNALEKREPLNTALPEEVQALWEKLRAQNHFAEVCPICGLRPIGYDDEALLNEIAKGRKVCAVCLSRRSGRARRWREENSQRTIWIEETADENGRAALICGRFNLDGWLNGDCIRGINKNPSFARIQRCWETTKTFWREIQDEDFPGVFGKPRPRLVISARDLPNVKKVGPFQACELKLGNNFMNVVFDRANKAFISADNLLAVAQALPKKHQKASDREKIAETKEQSAIDKQQVPKEKAPKTQEEAAVRIRDYLLDNRDRLLKNPSHYGETAEDFGKIHVEEVEIEKDQDAYFPLIPILSEPGTFICIVPANRALILAEAIKIKYTKEMGKVCDRLPLHIGLVFFRKYVPAGAVLDAGRRLLKNADLIKEEVWQIRNRIFYNANGHQESDLEDATDVELELRGQQTQRKARVRLSLQVNPEEKDPDLKWDKIHPQLRRVGMASPTDPATIWAGEVKENQEIKFLPSTFDYLFLDAASRRFESMLDKDAQRRMHPLWGLKHSPRPYNIDIICFFRELWEHLRCNPLLSTSKLYGIRDLLATKIEDWHVFDEPEDTTARLAYKALAEDILRKEFGYAHDHVYFSSMKAAMLDGSFFDCLDLYLHIMKESFK